MESKDPHDNEDSETTLLELLERQTNLETEASEVLPWKFDDCTHSRGYLRQPVYVCRTCRPKADNQPGGVCYSCSIACHADHDLIELGDKRAFRCDCGTERVGKPCELPPKERDLVNALNEYNHNYLGRFCWCDEVYHVETQKSTMYACVLCEDWFHETCICRDDFTIPDSDTFEDYICRTCAEKYPFLKPYKSSHMLFSGQSKKTASPKSTPRDQSTGGDAQVQTNASLPSNKRKLDESDDKEDGLSAKKPRSDTETPCKLEKFPAVSDEIQIDLFCAEGWRDELCRCSKCTLLYKQHNIEHVLVVEETYEPPKDEDASISLFESGMKLITQMDRVTAIEGLIAYNKMRDEIVEFLKPFVESGKTVTEQDVRAFFAAKLSERKTPETGPFF